MIPVDRRPIRQLDPVVSAAIAAGEVIERPAAAVKELVENALDASAGAISVEVASGGLGLIRVTDDGHGIPRAELPLAVARHATSKLTRAAELTSIATLGFRGEALATIGAVGDLTVASRLQDAPGGASIRVAFGQLQGLSGEYGPAGTTVTVRGLFSTVPARRKFLRSDAAETSRIREVVTQYALARPDVRFQLVADGRTLLQTPGDGDTRAVAALVHSAATARALLAVEPDSGETQTGRGRSAPDNAALATPVQVSGFVSPPGLSRPRRDGYSFFVNRRWVHNAGLVRAVEDAYTTLLPLRRHPIAILYLDLPLDQVDANVHPAKTEVRFQHDADVQAAVRHAVYRTLTGQLPIAAVLREAGRPLIGMQQRLLLRERGPRWVFQHEPEDDADDGVEMVPRLRLVGQLSRTFILAEGPADCTWSINTAPTSACSSSDYKRSGEARPARSTCWTGSSSSCQRRSWKRAFGARPILERSGFLIEPFGHSAVVVRTVPALLQTQGSMDDLLSSVLRELIDAPLAEWEDRMLATVACRIALRAGQHLTRDEMRELLALLEQTQFPETCPHAAPIIAHVTQRNLERHFNR